MLAPKSIIPKVIKDGPFTYKISKVKKLPKDEEAHLDLDKHVIKLKSTLEQNKMEERFFHELLHLALLGTALSDLLRELPLENAEETFVSTLSERLYGLLKNNGIL